MKTEIKVEVKTKDEDGNEVVEKFVVKRPTNDLIRRADRQRAKEWNECVADGVPTKQALRKQLTEKGLWSDKEDEKEKELRAELSKLEISLYKGDGKNTVRSIEEGKLIAIEVRKARFRLTQHLASINDFERNTADALANNKRFDFLVSACCFTESGDIVYKDLADYDSRASTDAAYACAAALAEMLHGVDAEFEEALPENKWLTDHKCVNKELSLVDAEGNLVDGLGRRISEDNWLLNEDGQKVDINGNLRDDEGNYISQVTYIDGPVKKTPVKKKTTKNV
jgi:hypothetical protein